MLRKMKISDPGDADQWLWGTQIDRTNFKRVNAEIVANGGKPAEAEPVLLDVTKASLETDSFTSARPSRRRKTPPRPEEFKTSYPITPPGDFSSGGVFYSHNKGKNIRKQGAFNPPWM